MKIYDIMMYLLIFNMMLSILVQIDIFSATPLQPYTDTLDYEEYASQTAHISSELSVVDMIYMSAIAVFKAIPMLVLAFLQATVLLPWFLSSALNLSLSNPIIVMFTGLVWLVYSMGILQLWMRQSVEHMA